MKKLLITLTLLFIGCAMFAQESSAPKAKKERMPMYVGANIGFDNWQSSNTDGSLKIRISSFEFEPIFGIKPFKKLPDSAIEFGLCFDTKGNGTSGNLKREAKFTALTVKYVHNFKPFAKIPKLSPFAFAGVAISGQHYEDDAPYTTEYSDVFGFTIPVGGGGKYAINEKFEAVAAAEFGLGSLLNFGMTAGINFKF